MRTTPLVLALLIGCSSGSPAIPLPVIDADAAAKLALDDYDTNRDGLLDANELEKCPPLRNSLEAFDVNGDKQVNAAEIANRLRSYREGNAGLIGVICEVTLDGKPLSGATVTLTPERFLGPNIMPASGVSNETGYVRLQTPGMDVEGVNYGLFRIEVSLKGSDGLEILPAKYNSETMLGVEVSLDLLQGTGGLTLALTRN